MKEAENSALEKMERGNNNHIICGGNMKNLILRTDNRISAIDIDKKVLRESRQNNNNLKWLFLKAT